VFLIVLAGATADASPAAEKLFRDGKALLSEGRLDEACDAFRRSHELEQKVGTLLNWADCEEKRGRTATAWAIFIEARALANREHDDRATEADRRAAALAPKLPYLTVRLGGATPPAGLVVRRNGIEVPPAEIGHEVPLDPGAYRLEATAPGYQSWQRSIELTAGARVVVEIPALPVPAAATPDAAAPHVDQTASAPAVGTTRRFAIGAALGGSTDSDVIGGLRGVLTLTAAGPGSIRLVPSIFYTRSQDDNDVYQHYDLVAVGLACEYMLPLVAGLGIASGLGIGVELEKDAYDNPLETRAWAAARVSPAYRLGPVDVGLHLQLVVSTRVVGLGELGVDYFF
jgi:hypothetical protein